MAQIQRQHQEEQAVLADRRAQEVPQVGGQLQSRRAREHRHSDEHCPFYIHGPGTQQRCSRRIPAVRRFQDGRMHHHTLKLKGVNYSISSACSTSAHCIGHAAELIQLGKQDIIIAGGAEQEHWTSSSMFDAMGALSSQYNDAPEKASRPFDIDRDGFVIAGGAGMLILEEEEHAINRNAPIIARLKGYCANSDGYDMVSPSGEGAKRCMSEALEAYGSAVDYINAHGTSTPVGDLAELSAIKSVFGKNAPVIGSTKSMTGHSLGATGAQEAIYSILMMQHDFIAPSINIETLVEEAEGLNICQSMMKQKLNSVMSNSFGFGGTNASLIFSK